MFNAIENLTDRFLAFKAQDMIEEALLRRKNRFILMRPGSVLGRVLVNGHPNQRKRFKPSALAYRELEFTFEAKMVHIKLEIVWNH